MHTIQAGTDPTVVERHRFSRFAQLKATERLPTPTGVALVILQLVDNEHTPVAEICRVLQADPALTGRLLKLANSAAVARSPRLTHVKDAVSVLGLRQVRNIALGFSLVSKHATGLCASFPYHDFWSGSLATALAAQLVAAKVQPRAASDAFTCGLLQTIGQLALATVFPAEYDTVLRQAKGAAPADLLRLEQERFGVDHHQLTSLMLQDWKLPPPCIEAVRWSSAHVQAQRDADTPALARVLHLAAVFGAISVAPLELQFGWLPGLTERGELLDIAGSQLYELGHAVMKEWQEWSGLLQIQARSLPSFVNLEKWFVGAQAAPESAIVEVPADGQLQVLAADGAPAELDNLKQLLEGLKCRVITAKTGREALQRTLEDQPDVLLVAATLPDMDGLALCRILRLAKSTQKLRIIVLSDQDGDEPLVLAAAAGADDCLARPLRPKVLEAKLRILERGIQCGVTMEQECEQHQRLVANLDLANLRLQEEVLTDALTGLPNRRFGMNCLEASWQADSQPLPLACMLMDIDHFKQVNDRFGHDAGDAVLRETAAILRGSLRQNDVVCRWGGEEFLIIAPSANLTAARNTAERLRGAVETRLLKLGAISLRVTASIGVAIRNPVFQEPDELLKAADRALYFAKQNGRNCVGTSEDVNQGVFMPGQPWSRAV